MGLLDFFRSVTTGGVIVDDYMNEARKLHKEPKGLSVRVILPRRG